MILSKPGIAAITCSHCGCTLTSRTQPHKNTGDCTRALLGRVEALTEKLQEVHTHLETVYDALEPFARFGLMKNVQAWPVDKEAIWFTDYDGSVTVVTAGQIMAACALLFVAGTTEAGPEA